MKKEKKEKKKKKEEKTLIHSSELMPVIHVRIVVFGDHYSVGKLASGQSLHGFLTLRGRDVLHKDLQWQKPV